MPAGATVVFSAHGVAPSVHENSQRARARRDRRDLPARHEGARPGAAVRRGGLHGDPHRPRRPRGGRGHDGRGARRRRSSSRTSPRPRRSTSRPDERVAYVTQTTLSVDETAEIIAALRRRFPEIDAPKKEDICYATSNRQWAVKEMLGGDRPAARDRLAELVQLEPARRRRARGWVPAYLIDDETEIDERWLDGVETVGITSGASAPGDARRRVSATGSASAASSDRAVPDGRRGRHVPAPGRAPPRARARRRAADRRARPRSSFRRRTPRRRCTGASGGRASRASPRRRWSWSTSPPAPAPPRPEPGARTGAGRVLVFVDSTCSSHPTRSRGSGRFAATAASSPCSAPTTTGRDDGNVAASATSCTTPSTSGRPARSRRSGRVSAPSAATRSPRRGLRRATLRGRRSRTSSSAAASRSGADGLDPGSQGTHLKEWTLAAMVETRAPASVGGAYARGPEFRDAQLGVRERARPRRARVRGRARGAAYAAAVAAGARVALNRRPLARSAAARPRGVVGGVRLHVVHHWSPPRPPVGLAAPLRRRVDDGEPVRASSSRLPGTPLGVHRPDVMARAVEEVDVPSIAVTSSGPGCCSGGACCGRTSGGSGMRRRAPQDADGVRSPGRTSGTHAGRGSRSPRRHAPVDEADPASSRAASA